MPDSDLNPAQERVLRELFDRGGPRPLHDPALAPRLKAELAERTHDAVERLELAGRTISVSKHAITTVLSCEQHWAQPDEFAWSHRTARGTVTHKAAELLLVGKLPGPPDAAVEAALEILRGDGGSELARFLDLASAAEIAELRARAVTSVTALLDAFPPIGPGWQTRAEQSLRFALADRTVVLSAKPDLAFGRPRPPDARVLLIDFKTGQRTQADLDDARFYALVHTLVYGIPPWRVATFFVDEAAWTAEDVDAAVLEAALRRTSDAIVRMAELVTGGRAPGVTANVSCRWCGLRATCPGAEEWAARSTRADRDDELDRMPF